MQHTVLLILFQQGFANKNKMLLIDLILLDI